MKFAVSPRQVFLLVFLTSFCVTPFGFPDLHPSLGRHIWLAALAQMAVTLTGALGVIALLGRFPGLSLPELLERAAGRVPARVYLALLGLFFFVWGPVGNQRTLLKMIQAADLPLTAPALIVAAMVLAAGYAVYFGPEVIARTTELWSFLVLPALVVIILLTFFQGELGQLLPLTGMPPGFWIDGTFWGFALGLRGFILALVFGSLLRDARQAAWPVLGGSLASGVLVTVLMLTPQVIFRAEGAHRFRFPVLDAMDTVNTAAVGIQSFLSLTLFLWYLVGWVVVAATLFAASYTVAAAVGLPSHRWLLGPLGLAAVAAGSLFLPQEEENLVLLAWSVLGYIVGIAGVWLLVLLARRRPRHHSPGPKPNTREPSPTP